MFASFGGSGSQEFGRALRVSNQVWLFISMYSAKRFLLRLAGVEVRILVSTACRESSLALIFKVECPTVVLRLAGVEFKIWVSTACRESRLAFLLITGDDY